jgi:nicotinamidase/pyrazinamidase
MKYILVDVDTQNAFAAPDGNLTVWKDGITNRVIENIRALVAVFMLKQWPITGSVDSHSYDSWEFAENGGPFPGRHAVKGTRDWLKIDGTLPTNFRFLPMSTNFQIGEAYLGLGNRRYTKADFGTEARKGVGLYFEKEVYSMFCNPAAEHYYEYLVEQMGGKEEVTFVVVGFCTGGFCVDGAVEGLLERGYNVIVIEDATQAIDGANAADGAAYSRERFLDAGAQVMGYDDFAALATADFAA